MSSALFRRLCAIRTFKVDDAQREVAAWRERLARSDEALRAARLAQAAQVAHRHGVAAQWRAQRLALAAFGTMDRDGHEAELRRCDRGIAQALAVVEQRLAEREEVTRGLHAAQQALARCRVALNKAERGVSIYEALGRAHDEAMEEDMLDELAVTRGVAPPGELRA
jgi:primosomal protein N''